MLSLLPVGNCFSQSIVEEAALVDQWYSHEATQSRHSLEVHAWLTHNLWHVDVLEALEDIEMLHSRVALLISLSGHLGATSVGLSEDVMSHTDGGLQHCTLNELMRLVGMDKLDYLG